MLGDCPARSQCFFRLPVVNCALATSKPVEAARDVAKATGQTKTWLRLRDKPRWRHVRKHDQFPTPLCRSVFWHPAPVRAVD
eukprot:scaffold3013_cov113-Isochrysis_galbana.AAC.12